MLTAPKHVSSYLYFMYVGGVNVHISLFVCFCVIFIGNNFGDVGAIAMAAALKKDSTLTSLLLQSES